MVNYQSISNSPSNLISNLASQLDQHGARIIGHNPEDQFETNASKASATVNLANTILGTGMLAMPAALASIGLIPGIIMIIYAGTTSALGLYFLSQCAERVGGRNHTFSSLSQLIWPKLGVVLPSFFPETKSSALLMDRRFWIAFSLGFLCGPISYLRKLDSLKYTSSIAILAVAYLTIIVLYYAIVPDFPLPESIDYFRFDSDFFTKLPIFIFAFTCHQNIFTAFNEMGDNSEKSMISVIKSAIGLAGGIYEVVAVLGYICFGNTVKDNIILEYPQNYFVAFGEIAIVILILFSFPLQVHPCRASLENVIRYARDQSYYYNTRQRHFILTTFILLITLAISSSVTSLGLVLAFVGSTGSTAISFILPGLFYTSLFKDRQTWKNKVALFLCIYGFSVMIISLSLNIKSIL
ncbi:hypothetical protein K501DRAFT_179311 [Backusella circina FSU 941]|nr:hypothetical protein K501DRAFT_179311 [Backusella circina FSU 941]